MGEVAAPRVTREDAEEYTQSLGQILGGGWRQIHLARKLGIPQALGLSVDQWVRQRLGGYIQLTVEDRRAAVAELAAEGESQRAIAGVLGVSPMTVNGDIAVQNRTLDDDAGAVDAGSNPDDVQNRTTEPHTNSRAVVLTGDPEWYTPARYVEAVRRVLGAIDLDPASNDFAQAVVRAARFFTEADDGLAHAWSGLVFLNPPFKHPAVEHFVQKLVDSYRDESVSAAVLLTNTAADTGWWQTAAIASSAICFTRGRISFYQRDGSKNSPTHGQTFFYFGADVDAFAREFGEFGLAGRLVR